MTDDPTDMDCQRWTEAISAIADGETPGVDPRLVDAHVQRCRSCQSFRSEVAATRGAFRVTVASPMPDLSRRVVKSNAVTDRASTWGAVRALLAMVAVEIIVISAPALILGDETGASRHDARHLGAFGVAYAVGLLVVTVRPARARTMLPVAQVLGVALVVSAVIDVATGSVGLIGEIGHLPELASVALLWLLALPAPRHANTTASSPPRPMRLIETETRQSKKDQAG